MTDKLKSGMAHPFLEIILCSSEVVIDNNDLIRNYVNQQNIIVEEGKKAVKKQNKTNYLTSFFSFSINLSTR